MLVRKILIAVCLLLGALATIFDGMLLLGFTRSVQYAWNIGFFVVLLPLGIVLWNHKSLECYEEQ